MSLLLDRDWLGESLELDRFELEPFDFSPRRLWLRPLLPPPLRLSEDISLRFPSDLLLLPDEDADLLLLYFEARSSSRCMGVITSGGFWSIWQISSYSFLIPISRAVSLWWFFRLVRHPEDKRIFVSFLRPIAEAMCSGVSPFWKIQKKTQELVLYNTSDLYG